MMNISLYQFYTDKVAALTAETEGQVPVSG